MSHAYNEHRNHKVQKNRVAHIAGKAAGGSAHADVAADKKLIRSMVKQTAMRADGGAVRSRADRPARAKGGRVKGTTVNVIVAPKSQDQAAPPMAAMPPPMPPKPPVMPAPAPAGPIPGLGGMPPGGPPMPPRSDGGRAYKRGGGVKGKMSGEKKHGKKAKPFKMRAEGGSVPMPKPRPEGKEPQPSDLYSGSDAKRLERGRATGGKVFSQSQGSPKSAINTFTPNFAQGTTQVQHSGNKSDTQNIGRKAPITRATGGPIYSDGRKGKQMAWLKGVGAGGGEGRLKKAHHAK